MKKLNNKGQVVIGLAVLVGLVAFMLMSNLQSENKLLVSKILDVRSRLEAESAIDFFGQELYKSYLLSSVIPDSIANDRRFPVTTADPTSTLEFNINGNKLCSQRKVGTKEVPICITLPADFLALLRKENLQPHKSVNYVKSEFLNSIFGQNLARAEVKKNILSQPVPGVAAITTITRIFNPLFTKQYSRYNCNSDPTVLKCVKVKICIKPSGCTALLDKDKVIQTYVFTLAPKTQLRD